MRKYCFKARSLCLALVFMLVLVAVFASCNEVPTMSEPEADTFKPADDLMGDGDLAK